jgi:predicted nucleic acid-binding protein
MSVFVDTSALYALLVASEERHAEVKSAFARLLKAARPLVTTSYVLVETTALLQHRIGLDPVRDLTTHVVPLLENEWVGEALHREAMQRLLREDRRRLSLVDCVSLELMRRRGIDEVLALDSDFAKAGHRVLPRARD